MIVCPNCGKENQDHYKFCLGCGGKLPAVGAAPAAVPPVGLPPPSVPRPVVIPPLPGPQGQYPGGPQYPPAGQQPPQYPPQGQGFGAPPAGAGFGAPPQQQPPFAASPQDPNFGTQATAPPAGRTLPESAPPPPAPVAPAAPRSPPGHCNACGTDNPPQFKFCGGCGGRLGSETSVGAPPSAPQPQPQPQPVAAPPPDAGTARTMFADAGQVAALAAAGQPPAAPAPRATVRLVLLRDDGSEGGVLVIEGGPERIGRAYGPPFDSDAYLDLEHCQVTATSTGLVIEDLGSLNGVYLKLLGRCELHDHDMFRVGQELILYEDLPEPAPSDEGTEIMGSPNPGYWGRLSVMVSKTRAIAAYPLQDAGVTIGREQGQITFPDDGYVSGTHCRIGGDDSGVFLEDLGSSNGTYMRVRSGDVVQIGTLILVGQQLFRIDPG